MTRHVPGWGVALPIVAAAIAFGGTAYAQSAGADRTFQTTSENGRYTLAQTGASGGRCSVVVTDTENSRRRWTSSRCLDRNAKITNDGDTVVEVIEVLRNEEADGVRVWRRGRPTKSFKACLLLPQGATMQRASNGWTWLDLSPSLEQNGERIVLQVLGGFRVVFRLPQGEPESAIRRRCRGR